jgi:hypothetical protein
MPNKAPSTPLIRVTGRTALNCPACPAPRPVLEPTIVFSGAWARPFAFASSVMTLVGCQLPQVDVQSEFISESRYEVSCSADSDCIVVNGGMREDLCNKACNTSSHMSISRTSREKYAADLMAIECRATLSVESCTDRKAKAFCNNSGKCDRKY